MARKWTKEERKKHLWERYYERREKAVIIGLVVLGIIGLLVLIYYSLSQKWGIEITFGLIAGLFVWIVVSTFILDSVLWEGL